MLEPDEASALIARNPKNKDCLFPYLNGEDLNSRPDQSPSRWVINFQNFPLNRTADGVWLTANEEQRKQWLRSGYVPFDYPKSVAEDYPDLIQILIERVKTERDELVAKGKQIHEYCFWKFWDRRDNLYATIAKKEKVLVTSRHNKILIFEFVKSDLIYSEALAIFAVDRSVFSFLQSSIHDVWAWQNCSTIRDAGIRYSPTDGFETFPFPIDFSQLKENGERYLERRQSILQSRREGLTKTYNRFHDPAEAAEDIVEFRRLQVEMDNAVASAYGWQDLPLDHGFHETKQGIRYTISEAARREVLDRLLELNHQRYAEEVAAGLHDKKSAKSAGTGRGRKKKAEPAAANEPEQFQLF